MLSRLPGLISAVDLNMIMEKTNLIFNNPNDFKTPEALLLYQQRLLDSERILSICTQEYNIQLYTPRPAYVPREVMDFFEPYPVVVISYDIPTKTVELGTLPEFNVNNIFSQQYSLKFVAVPIYYYVELRTQQFGPPNFLSEMPARDLWDFVVEEAIRLDASDITLTTTRNGAEVYYNVRKKKVHSRRVLSGAESQDIINILASRANATIAEMSSDPRYFGVDLNKNYRGRVCVNKTVYGMLCTIRVLPNAIFNKTLESLNIDSRACKFIRQIMLKREKGLRLFIGETMSGKNTTILSSLRELVSLDTYKIVSLEQPVEILVDGIEQIGCETDEEFEKNADSLLRQNPDIEYFTEITARTAGSILRQANTGKMVFSTVHANSLHEVFFRLQDMTGFSLDRLLLNIHSLCYQELVRDEATDSIRPVNVCFYLTDDMRSQLLDTSFKNVFDVLRDYENKWRSGENLWIEE